MRPAVIALAILGALAAIACTPSPPAEQIAPSRGQLLSEHLVSPYAISPAPDGGYVVAGSNNISDTWGWAVRLRSSGDALWQYVDGPPGSWEDLTPNVNRFGGAVVLPDDNTVLCGTKHKPPAHHGGHLVLLSPNGAIINQQYLFPEGKSAHLVWEKRIPSGRPVDVAETSDHELLLLSGDEIDARNSRLDRIDPKGNSVLMRRINGEARFVRDLSPQRVPVGIITEELPDGPTQLVHLDSSLNAIGKPIDLGRSEARAAYQLEDKSIIIFGSIFSGGWNAAFIRVYANSSIHRYPLGPLHTAFWLQDALPTGVPNEFVTVFNSLSERTATITWVSIKPQ